jgi:deoxyribonuclease-4
MDLIIGSHVGYTKDNGLLGSVLETLSYGANTFMFYTGAPQNTARLPINIEKRDLAIKKMEENGIDINNVIVHAPYIINLANKSDEDKYNFYINFFAQELDRCKKLGMNKIVLHPGSATTCTKEEAIKNIANALNIVFSKTENTIVLLEFMAGKGNEVGTSIDELKSIIELIDNKDRIGVCLDTCHMNDSYVDISKFDEFLDEFDSKIGIDKIKCVHINDSMNERGSHKDRHANIGYGTIGFDNLVNVAYNKRLEGLPFILETPYINRNTKDERPPYKEEIESIRNKKFIDFIQ